MRFIGIDPGQSGGIAMIDTSSGAVDARKMPQSWGEFYDMIEIMRGRRRTEVIVERVWGRPGNGVRRNWTFGMHYGGILACLEVMGVTPHLVPPTTWMKALGCETRGDKTITKTAASGLFPDIKVTHAIADALLIAHFGSLTYG